MLKYKIGVLFLTLMLICTVNFAKADQTSLNLLGKIIYIDPGHGGVDPGAIHKDVKESSINLEISKKIQLILEANGAIVYLTRYGDYDLSVINATNRKRSDLSRRASIINTSNCDLYISIHLNSELSSTWYGAQVFYDDVNIKNKEIAELIQQELKNNLRTRRQFQKMDDMYMYKRINRPGVLIEVGFLSNPNERFLLKTANYQQKIANTVSNAIMKYFAIN